MVIVRITGADNSSFDSNSWHQVVRGAEPFNMPAGIALNDAGEIYIADGYANARVHKFTPTGEHIFSWGEPGAGPGQFNLPHGAWINRQGNLLIADRENDRVQVFNQDGTHVADWPSKLIGPAVICVDDDDVAYVAEHNGGMLSILDSNGERLAQWGRPDPPELPRCLGGQPQGPVRGRTLRRQQRADGREIHAEGLARRVGSGGNGENGYGTGQGVPQLKPNESAPDISPSQ